MNTPETDARVWSDHSEGILHEVVEASFARRLERERDEARRREDIHYDSFIFAQREVFEMKEAIIATLEENRHLSDGDDCTLAKLKSVVPEWK